MGGNLNQRLQFFPLEPVPSPRPAEHFNCSVRPQHLPAHRPTLKPHPTEDGVYLESAGRDGVDFIRVCVRHQWASIPHPEHAPACPLCLAEFEERAGRLRYADVHTRLVLGL